MNISYKAITHEYVAWLDTLGFSDAMIYDYKFRVYDFFQWLENRQIQSINLLTNKHMTEYHAYLETRQNKKIKGRLLSHSHLNHSFLAIDKLLEFLHHYGMTNAPAPTNYRIKIDEQERISKIVVLTQQEIKTLYNTIPNTYTRFLFAERQAFTKSYRTTFITTATALN